MSYVIQRTFPLEGSVWNPGPGSLVGYRKPSRREPRGDLDPSRGLVSVIGTVRNEAVAWGRSWAIWSQQRVPDGWRVVFWVLDDGSRDKILDEFFAAREAAPEWADLRFARFRKWSGWLKDRSCTLVFNGAIRNLVDTPLVFVQWWDRIPGSLDHLRLIVEPHLDRTGIVTSGVSRHIGASSSVGTMTSNELQATLDLVDWRDDPRKLAVVAGPIGGHCIPGEATESSAFCVQIDEFIALGGYDERYRERAGYQNVELFRRMLQAGLEVWFVPEPDGANYHQSHGADRDKDYGQLHDPHVRRNQGIDWGSLKPVEVFP